LNDPSLVRTPEFSFHVLVPIGSVTVNWVFTPKSFQREPEEQASIDHQTASLTLYQYEACPFCVCVKVRRAMKRHGLTIETRDVKRNVAAKDELLAGGGDLKVPCLRIGDGESGYRWMYESGEIIGYLEGRFVVG
jgi:glutaredoxin